MQHSAGLRSKHQLTQLIKSANCPNNNTESVEKSHRRAKPSQFSRTLTVTSLYNDEETLTRPLLERQHQLGCGKDRK